MQITIVGAGVIGLTTALVLEEHGHTVRIVAAATDDATTSAVAGAVWFPYRVGPPDRVALWAATTRAWLVRHAHEADAGIDILDGFEITTEPEEAAGHAPPRPWWAMHIDVVRAPAPVTGAPAAWKFTAPRVEPARFLPYLASRLRARIERRTVTDLAAEPGDIVVNCAGLGARELAGDDALSPLLGQIAIASVGTTDLRTTITDHRDPEAIFYVIPRRDELVLGGCSVPVAPGTTPLTDDAITARILAQAAALGLPIGAVTRTRVGLRPYRPTVRLERPRVMDPSDPAGSGRPDRVIHNYGHGGAGFTLCYGCAEDVAKLVPSRDDPDA
ncbi:MAG: FAD-dependent oxidoreductase [Kofleriaceae bacterium]